MVVGIGFVVIVAAAACSGVSYSSADLSSKVAGVAVMGAVAWSSDVSSDTVAGIGAVAFSLLNKVAWSRINARKEFLTGVLSGVIAVALRSRVRRGATVCHSSSLISSVLLLLLIYDGAVAVAAAVVAAAVADAVSVVCSSVLWLLYHNEC